MPLLASFISSLGSPGLFMFFDSPSRGAETPNAEISPHKTSSKKKCP